MQMDQIGFIQSAAGAGRISQAEAEHALGPQAAIHPGSIISTADGAHAEIVFEDGTVISLGDQSSLEVRHYSHASDAPGSWSMELSLHQGTFRILSGQIAENADRGIQLHTPSAMILMDEHGGNIVVHDGLVQVGSAALDAPGLLVTTAAGTARIADGILDIMPDGRFGEVRGYSDFEEAYFKSVAPLSGDPADEPSAHEDAQDQDSAGPEDEMEPAHAFVAGPVADATGDAPDGEALLSLFTTYFGQMGANQGLAHSLFQQLAQAPALEGGLATATTEALQSLAANDGERNAPGDDDSALNRFLEDNEDALRDLFTRWTEKHEIQSTQLAETIQAGDATSLNAPQPLEPHVDAARDNDELLVQNEPGATPTPDSGSGIVAPVDMPLSSPNPEPQMKNGEDFDGSYRVQNQDTDFNGNLNRFQAGKTDFGGSTDSHNLLGGGETDTLDDNASGDAPTQESWSPEADQHPASPTYDDWSAAPESSETTTNDTYINVPEYSLSITYYKITLGWFTVKVPVPVIKVHYTEQLISSETTTTTSYNDGSVESQTMLDSDADGHWNQSSSTLTYGDGAQRTVTLFDQDDDGSWDSYETSLIYQDGEVASSDSGSYAEAPQELLDHLALAADDPSQA